MTATAGYFRDMNVSMQDSMKSTSEAIGGLIKVGSRYIGSGDSPLGIVKIAILAAGAVGVLVLLRKK